MKCSELWLREWVNPELSRDALCETLTMAGLEVDECAPVAQAFSSVVVGYVTKVEKHPKADRLHYCEVDIGSHNHLYIVCGAKNVRAGIKVPVALINAVLPGDVLIQATSIRDLPSQGMLCSAYELGLAAESEGILELSSEAPVGQNLRSYLMLDDYVFDIAVTPNRGDCLSIRGIAREVAALTRAPLSYSATTQEGPTKIQDKLEVTVQSPKGCPRYIGRIIRNIRADVESPMWLKERLRRSGIRSIHPAVDITNYVMLELGQPMHAFDLHKIQQGIEVRLSKEGENILLLDGNDITLDKETLVIADHDKALAIAGVMGGLDSSVTSLTRDIFLESAYFVPQVIARQRQYYGLQSDSAYRFERGIDPTIQHEAMERATQLILAVLGGKAGPITDITHDAHLPKETEIFLPAAKIQQVLGISLSAPEVDSIFKALQFSFTRENNGWRVVPPLFRFDITLPEDLIEEIARIHGYNNIPSHRIRANLATPKEDEAKNTYPVRQIFSDLGYQEIISYSFIDKKLHALLDPDQPPYVLVNPLTAEMGVMRTNLWPGLINAMLYNQSRQQRRIRLFEIGTCFIAKDHLLSQPERLAGLITGSVFPEQWGDDSREVDFYDLKGDLLTFLETFLKQRKEQLKFQPESHKALHPGQTAGIYFGEQKIGVLGALHPAILQALDIPHKVFVFEMDISEIETCKGELFQEVSKFPDIRRDIAILVNQAIPANEIQDTIKVVAGDWLKEVFIFDVYQGKGILPDHKSIALALIWQHPSRTLVDEEVTELMDGVLAMLKRKLGAELRS